MKDYTIYLRKKKSRTMQKKEKKKDQIFFLRLLKEATSQHLSRKFKKSK